MKLSEKIIEIKERVMREGVGSVGLHEIDELANAATQLESSLAEMKRANEHLVAQLEIQAELMPHDIGILAHNKLGELAEAKEEIANLERLLLRSK